MSSPEVQNAFAHTDMERQKAMLHASLYQLMNLYEHDDDDARKHVQELGAKHGVHGHRIPPHFYDLWLDSLMKTVKAADSMFSPELEATWREVMSKGIELMKDSAQRYPEMSQEKTVETHEEVIRSADLKQIIAQLRAYSKEAAHRSNMDKDIEVTAFQFGQYRAYLHASEMLSELDKYALKP